MAKGGYNGGSTILGPGSNWFSRSTPKQKRKAIYKNLSEAEIQERIKQASLRLEGLQADFDAGRLKPPAPPRPALIESKKQRLARLRAIARTKIAASRVKKTR